MTNTVQAFILTSLAGFSTMIGALFIFMKKKETLVMKALSFAAGVMIAVSITDLIPEGQNLLKEYINPWTIILITFLFLIIGILISISINHYLPESSKSNSKLYRVGIISMLAIIIHNIPEGIATFITSSHNLSLGISLTIAIALHNIPEGISISIPIFYASESRKKAIFYTFISGMSELLGALLAFLFLGNLITEPIMGMIYITIAGIMIHISLNELLPTSLNYHLEKKSLLYFCLGIGIMLLNHYCF